MADERLRVLLEVAIEGAQDVSGLRDSLTDLDQAVSQLSSKFSGIPAIDVPITADASAAEDTVSQVISTLENISAVDIPLTVTGDTEALTGLNESLKETETASKQTNDTVGIPFVVTAGDAINQAKDLSSALEGIATSYAKTTESAGRISLINSGGPSVSDIQAIAQAGISADHTINDNLALLSKLDKKGVDTYKGLTEGMQTWSEFGEANGMTGAAAWDSTMKSFNAFEIPLKEAPQYFDQITTIAQKTSVGMDGFAAATNRVGYEVNAAGMDMTNFAGILMTGKAAGMNDRKMYGGITSGLKEIADDQAAANKPMLEGAALSEALAVKMGLLPAKLDANIKKLKESAGTMEAYVKVEETGHTAMQNLTAEISKITYGFQGMVAPLEPIAAGVLGIGMAGANLLIFDSLVTKGTLATGLSDIISKLPLVGTAASGSVGGVTGLSGALTALGGPLVLGALAIGIGAYATNLGGFRDNVNDIAKEIGDAGSNIATGNYEQAGRDMAEAVGKGFGAVGDLVIKGLPQAATVVSGFKTGMQTAGKEVGKGFADSIVTGMASLIETLSAIGADGGKSYISGMYSNLDLSTIDEKIVSSLKNIDWAGAGINGITSMFGGAVGAVAGLAPGLADAIITAIKREIVSRMPGMTQDILNSALKDVPVVGGALANMGNAGAPINTGVNSITSKPTSGSTIINVAAGWTPTGITPLTAAISNNTKAQITAKDVTSTQMAAYKGKGYTADSFDQLTEKGADLTKVKQATADWLNAQASQTSAATGTTAAISTLGTESKNTKLPDFKSVEEAMKAGVDSFTVGTKEYKKKLDDAGNIIAEEQGWDAESARKKSEISIKQTEQDAAEQKTANDKIVAEQGNTANAIKAFNTRISDASRARGYAKEDAKDAAGIGKADTTYTRTIADIIGDAAAKGISESQLDFSGIGEDIGSINSKLSGFKAALTDELGKAIIERDSKKAKKDGTPADTTAIDTKIKKIQDEITALDDQTIAVKANTVAHTANTATSTTSSNNARFALDTVTPAVKTFTDTVVASSNKIATDSDVEGRYPGPGDSSAAVPIMEGMAKTFNSFIASGETRENALYKAQITGYEAMMRRTTADYAPNRSSPNYENDLLNAVTDEMEADMKVLSASLETTSDKATPATDGVIKFSEELTGVADKATIASNKMKTFGAADNDATIFKFGKTTDASADSIAFAGNKFRDSVSSAGSKFAAEVSSAASKQSTGYTMTPVENGLSGNNYNPKGSGLGRANNPVADVAAVTIEPKEVHCVFAADSVQLPELPKFSSVITDFQSEYETAKTEIQANWGKASAAQNVISADTGAYAAVAAALATITAACPPAASGLETVGPALQGLASYASAAVSQINALIGQATAAVATAGKNNNQSGEFSQPQTFASGGKVKTTGMALVHEGEEVINRNDVNQLMRPQQSQGLTQHLNFDMRGATIDKNTSKDLPRLVARAAKRSLGRIGA